MWFFFNDTATTEIYTLSLHDALPISALTIGCVVRARRSASGWSGTWHAFTICRPRPTRRARRDRKSTRLNSSHANISYAVFCLKKKMDDSDIEYLTNNS